MVNFQAPAALNPGKEPRYPLDKEPGGSLSWTGHGVEREKSYVRFKRYGDPSCTLKLNV